MTRHLSKTLCLAGIILLYCATITQAQKQGQDGFYMMICRGANSAFRIDDVRREGRYGKFGLNFLPSSTAPRGDYKKINAGTCSWDDRTVNGNEPKQIQFYAPNTIANSIRTALNTPDRFWVFYVRLTKYGYFEARSQREAILR